MTGMVKEQNSEKKIGKQMGCMPGFFQIFDPHHILTGKRLHTIKRLPSKASRDTKSERNKNVELPAMSKETEQQPQGRSSPEKSPCHRPIFEFDEGSTTSPWKFSKEAPRLSLDSRAVVDANGSLKHREIRTNSAILSSNQCESNREEEEDKQRCSISVVARLMGLEPPLPDSDIPEPNTKLELRRSASEARGRDLFHNRFIDGVNFWSKVVKANGARQELINNGSEESLRNARAEPVTTPVQGMVQRKRFNDSDELYPEIEHTVSIYGEIDKRLKLRGIDEPLKDSLLHSTKPQNQIRKRNLVYEHEQSPIVVIKPAFRRTGNDSPPSTYRSKPGGRLNSNLRSQTPMSTRRDRSENEWSLRNQRKLSGVKSPSKRPLRIEMQRRVSPVQSARVNVRRTKLDQTRNKSTAEIYQKEEKDETSTVPECSISSSSQTDTERLKVEKYKEGRRLLERCDKLVNSIAEMTETTTELQPSPVSVLVSSFDSSTSPVMKRRIDFKVNELFGTPGTQNSTQQEVGSAPETMIEEGSRSAGAGPRKLKAKVWAYFDRVAAPTPDEPTRFLLNCKICLKKNKLTSYKWKTGDGTGTPTRHLKNVHGFKGQGGEIQTESVGQTSLGEFAQPGGDQFDESEDEIWSPASAISSAESKPSDKSNDCDFIYIFDILRASNYLPYDTDVFSMLEKQQYLKGKDTSKVYRLQRKLIFDTINEILNRKGQLPPWKLNRWSGETSLQQIWSEFQNIRKRDSSDDWFEVICGVLRKDLAGDAINGWEDCPIEMSEAVLDIEGLVFNDLIVETIRELAEVFAKGNKIPATRRKLVF